MSDSFRDLERPDAAHRKAAVLMASISALECLDHPTRQDMARFSRLFMPLYAAASPETRRTVSATLSRLSRVPDDVVDMLINEPIAIAAPFIAHYPRLKESALARCVARNGAPHARAAARRPDLSPQAIAALRGLNDPSVEGLLILRGLIPDPALEAREAPAQPAPVKQAPKTADALPVITAPPLDPSEKLRAVLRNLAQRSPATPSPLNRPTSRRKPDSAATPLPQIAPDAADAENPGRTAVSAETRSRFAKVQLAKLARYATSDQASWFATALADAMGSSFALAERIMMDLSGRQLATALIGLGAPETTIKSALESFFPHMAQPSKRHTLATDLIEELDSESCAARLAAWQRADDYTNGASQHVPVLADGKPVRQAATPRPLPETARRTTPARKTG
ncbi:hypothetical protein [Hoeflea ulvae]|uniref:DUF2336 domain-containing protein n=1 Tax=Hoeflea ulvae TaxID=2983764 RepID=A0ABT3YEU3_9HYPH|nr:hypothetical protein [Hoeflea ulvae]MCY0094419.1 hypothetical protein [Hoeflea ulvae]